MKKNFFTLIEILTVISIIVILMGITLVALEGAGQQAGDSKTRARMERLKNALQEHYEDWGYYPQQSSNDESFNVNNFSNNFEDPNGNPYLSEEELDNDGNYLDGSDDPFLYQCPGLVNEQKYDLWSVGHNGQNDSSEREDDPHSVKDDITNWTQ